MKAAVYTRFGGPIQVETLPDPAPRVHGVVLKVLASGLCLSDWHGWKGHDADIQLPHVPGHELVGEIVALGSDVHHWQEGMRVTVPFVCGCGRCPECQKGDHQVCRRQTQPGFTHWGSFAELVALDYADTNLVALPDEMDAAIGAGLGCRFATAFRAVVDQAQLRGGDWLIVWACGGVGLSAIMIAKALGIQVIAIDIKDDKLKIAQDLGADFTLNSRQETNYLEAIQEYSGGGAHASLDALGHPQLLQDGIMSLRRRGKHVQVGLFAPEQLPVAVPMGRLIAWEIEILGSHGLAAHRYPEMLGLIQSAQVPVHKLLEERLSLHDVALALPQMDQYPGVGIRVMNRF